MKLRTTLVSLLITLVFFLSAQNALAIISCCGGTGSSDTKTCGTISGEVCPVGAKVCNPNLLNQTYVDSEGNDITYHPDCFIPISPPVQVKITDFGRLFSGAVSFLLLIAFILAFFYLILGGIAWLTSGGDKGNIETARNKIIAAIIGLIIVAATWALFQLVGGAIGFNILGGFELPTLF